MTSQNSIDALFKEIIRQEILTKNVAMNLGYTEAEWSDLHRRSIVLAEQEMLCVRLKAGDL